MPSPAEDRPFFLSEETWHLIQARWRKADWRRQRDIAQLAKPDADKLAAIDTRYVLERLAAYAIPALEKIFQPSHLASFLRSLGVERRFLLDVAMPILSEHIRSVFGSEPAADFEFRCELLVNADFDRWKSKGHRKVAEQLRHPQVQIARILELGISRLSRSPSSETDEWPVNGDLRRVDVPDSPTGEEINPAQAERAKLRKSVIEPILKQKGWSTNQWALESGVNYKTARDYRNGENKPREGTRSKLANPLGVSSLPE